MESTQAILEIGTSKIICLIGKKNENGNISILACESIFEPLLKNGKWVTKKSVPDMIYEVIKKAGRKCGKRITNVSIALQGSFYDVVVKEAKLPVKDANGTVHQADINRVIAKAGSFQCPEGVEILGHLPVYFILDDKKVYIHPVGRKSQSIYGKVAYIAARSPYLNDIERTLAGFKVKVNGFIPDAIAQGLYYIPSKYRDNLSILLDIGYFETGITYLFGDSVLFHSVIPVGGAQISMDLAKILQIDISLAENLKRKYYFGINIGDRQAKEYVKDQDGKMHQFSYDLVSDIIEARMEHLILLIKQTMKKSGMPLKKESVMFLTGAGVGMMAGAESYLARRIGVPVKKVVNTKQYQLYSAVYHGAIATLQYVFQI